MSCYIRHLTWMLEEAGRPDTRQWRRTLDRVIRSHLRLEGQQCNMVWREVKARLDDSSWTNAIVGELAATEA